MEEFAREMMKTQLQKYIIHYSAVLKDGRTIEECIEWFENGALPGETITEAYNFFLTGQIHGNFYDAQFANDFVAMRNHVNNLLEQERNKMIN
nr:protein FAR1-RELATED SEQUENCE 5-like [Ipomoea batatas]